MRNLLLVIRHEIVKTVGKPSFWLTAFLFPLLIFGITFGSQFVAEAMVEEEVEPAIPDTPGHPVTEERQLTGYVDRIGVIEAVPEGFPQDLVRAYADETAARAALQSDEIERYYIIAADFYATGNLTLIQDQFSPLEDLGAVPPFEYLLTYNLTGDPDEAALLLAPAPTVERINLAPQEEGAEGGEGGAAATAMPTLILFIFFFVLTMSSSFVLRSVTKEKETRVVELLLLSLRPRILMLGKILGLGVVALLQMVVWLGGAALILGEGAPIVGMVASAASLGLSPTYLLWVALYFLMGYLTFASALGALGTLAPNAREGNQFTFILLLPLMIPLWLNTSFSQAPNGMLATVLSIFPLTAPISMVTRLAATDVPMWQVLLSLGLLAATTYGFVLLAARFFRADTLLSHSPLDWGRIKRELGEQLTQRRA